MTRSPWVVTGAGGMLGTDLVAALRAAGEEVTALTRADLDITDAQACRDAVAGASVVVNAAAWTAVDQAESEEGPAFMVNAVGAATVAAAAATTGARLVQISTDYVFSGSSMTPYAEGAPLTPASAYGRTKAAGEWAVMAECPQSWVVRTAWLFGANGRNFVSTMARLAAERETLTVVDDQRGQPTWTADLAAGIIDLVRADAPFGIWHGTSAGETTWHGLARAVFLALGLDPERVQPISSHQYPLPAPRPAYSVLGHDRWESAGLPPLPHWEDALARALPAMGLVGP